MKRMSTEERRKQLQAIAAIKDEDIDFSDIPELTVEQLRTGVRGMFYRPIKKAITIRLDADVIAWLKQDGPGYQTKANRLLRSAMVESYSQKRGPRPSAPVPRKRKVEAR
jgi:uncharacterized protein (DUF4415 family)